MDILEELNKIGKKYEVHIWYNDEVEILKPKTSGIHIRESIDAYEERQLVYVEQKPKETFQQTIYRAILEFYEKYPETT